MKIVLLVGVLALVAVLALSEDARDFAGRTALLAWLAIGGLIGLGVWAVRQLPPRTERRDSPPGAQWFPLSLGWRRRRDDR